MTYTRQPSAEGRNDPAEMQKYLDLHDKHERARFEMLGAEHILRTDKPTRQ